MKFYIDNIETQVEVNPQLQLALDSTNDSFTCVLKANTRREPYKPMTPFKIEFDNSTTKTMWIISDNVSLFSMYPEAYKHSISVIQYRYFLNRHIIRNSVFNQPRVNNAKLYGAVSTSLYTTGSGSSFRANYRSIPQNSNLDPDYWTDNIDINTHSRFKNFKYKILMYGVTNRHLGTSNLVQITESLNASTNARIRSTARFILIDANNSNYQIVSFYIGDNYNGEFIIDNSIKDIINAYIETRGNTPIYLRLQYTSGHTASTNPERASAFAETRVSSVTDDFDPEDDTLYTFLTAQIFIEFELYNYTMYDVIDTLLKQYRQTTDQEGNKKPQLFNMPGETSELYSLLKNTYPPDTLSFTQCTFYEALEQIFRFYDAGFKFDESQTLQIEYYNDTQKEIQPEITGLTLAHSQKNYDNGRINYYQNAVKNIDLKKIKTRSKSLGVPEKNDYGIVLTHPIYTIKKLEYLVSGSITLYTPKLDNGTISATAPAMFIDLTKFVVNDDLWSALPKQDNFGSSDNTELLQINTIPFTRGSKFIGVSDYFSNFINQSKPILENVKKCAFLRFFGVGHSYDTRWSAFSQPNSQEYHQQYFNISYDAIINGRLEVETTEKKYLGEIITNQSDGLIDLEKLGLAIYSESLRDGVPTLSISVTLSAWDDRPVEGDYVIYNNEKWIVNIVTYNIIQPEVIRCEIMLTKNFNLTSLRIRNDAEKRLTSISTDLAVASEENFIDYVYVTLDPDFSENEETIIVNKLLITNSIIKTFAINNSTYSDYATIDYGGVRIGSAYINNAEVQLATYIPCIKYGSGNCLCFEFQYDDPVKAGDRLTKTSGWFGSDAYFSEVIKYTDDEGWKDKIDLVFFKSYRESAVYADYPILIVNNPLPTADKQVGEIGIEFYKKPNEIFLLNYELCFLPNPSEINDLFIGTRFINENGIHKDVPANKKFYLYYSTEDNKYSILDIKANGSTRIEATLSVSVSGETTTLNCHHDTISEEIGSFKSWSICDEDGNIYFASNSEITQNQDINIYFVPTRQRI